MPVRRRYLAAALTAALLAAGLVPGGCSPDRRYRILSTVFDGVPRPGETKEAAKVSSQYMRDDTPREVIKRQGYSHRPYADNRCGSCHPKDQSLFLAEGVQKKLCETCHQPFFERLAGLAFVHGPAAARSCISCHDPHESLQPHLVSDPAPKLCHGCHDEEAVRANPAHSGGAGQCLTCHDPHGGPARYFLRAEKKVST